MKSMALLIDTDLNYIITRNIKDFTHSSVKPLLPEEFLQISGLQ
jgi:hypothetical protein